MSSLALFPLVTSNQATVMETIMKPLSYARRPARWLMAAGLALAAMQPTTYAAAQPVLPDVEPELRLDTGPIPHPGHAEALPFFTKKGYQRDCDYVVYDLRFGARGDPEKFLDPAFIATLKAVRMDFRDQLPAGLKIVDVQASGDGTDAAGGPLPTPATSTTANPDDTATISDFRLSATDLDGVGGANERYISIRITAKIDHAAFPAATVVANQGFVKIGVPGGPSIEIPSHDPALPDDAGFDTGDPTKIVIDVTDCEPPPPPPPPGGEEPCFVVETGDVDCVPGGGAFIYHMPVGADLAGKWVQVRTTTPGIIVAPGPQLVPAGGGVLDWTITGAAPGDVVHLIVTGIETYAGPEEGVGLCCTQTVDLVIPPDLDCPDKQREPDLKVEKKADVVRCTLEGGCDFTITVTNVGDAPYNGPIVLDEVTTPGNAAVVSGPNVPWGCVPMMSPMVCTHPATTLNPGESVDLKLGFAPGPGWEARFIRNCAEYNYPASGHEAFGDPTNDKACAVIQICKQGDPDCRPPVEKKADLLITKEPLSLSCTADGICRFVIRVFNNGTDAYVGPLTVVDTYPTGAPTSSAFGPTPPWNCVEDSPDTFRCQHPGVNLLPGAFVPLTVTAVVPDGYPSDIIRNCGEVTPIPDETDLTNNRACATMRIPNRDPGQPGLRITKVCDGAVAGAAISCRITVSNGGTAAPSGPVRVNDAATIIGAGTPVQIQTVTPDGAEWACGPVPANALSCEIPGALLTPGTSRHFDVTVAVSPNLRFENCARGSFGPEPGGDVVYPIGEACAQGGATIRVEKTGDLQCRVGQPCTFEITITNDGTTGFSGPVRIGDAIGVDGFGRLEGVPIAEIVPPFGCSPEPATLPLSCVTNLTLGAGEFRVHQVTIIIPDDGRFDNLTAPVAGQNCVGVISPNTPVAGAGRSLTVAPPLIDPGRSSAFACHSFTILAEEKQQCSEGFVLKAGRCVCPEGTTFRNGQCTGGGTVTPIPPKKPQQCVLLPGQIRTQDGRCICPKGTDLRNGKCVKIEQPPVRQCKLLPGQIRTQDGRCICPRATELRNGKCVKIEQPPVRQCKLLPGQIRTQDGRCICPRATELRNGKCVKIEQPPVRQCKLLPGQIRTQDGRCVCPRGTSLVRGECRQRTVECPKGTRLVRGQCVTIPREIICREDQVLRNGQCVTVRQRPTLQVDPNLVNPDLLKKLLPPKRRPSSEENNPNNPKLQ